MPRSAAARPSPLTGRRREASAGPWPAVGLLVLVVGLGLAAGACGHGGSTTGPSAGHASVQLAVAQVPASVSAIDLTVTGDDLTPIHVSVPLDRAEAFVLDVPPGTRTFTVTVQAKGKAFSGTTTVRIAGGRPNVVTVSVALNEPPSVRVSASSTTAHAGDSVNLTCTASDPDGGPLTYTWQTSSGSLDATSGPQTTWHSAGGSATITCRVTDSSGAAGSASVAIGPLVTLTVTVTIDPGLPPGSTRSVTSAPGGIACTQTDAGVASCSARFPTGTTVTLTRSVNNFNNWTGATCTGTSGLTCVVQLGGDTAVDVRYGP